MLTKSKVNELKKKGVIAESFPSLEVGDTFTIKDIVFKVAYINVGKNRVVVTPEYLDELHTQALFAIDD